MVSLKPIFYYSVMTSNRGDAVIRKSITEAIKERINTPFAYFDVKHDELTLQRINQLNDEGACLMVAGSGLYSNYNTSSGWYFPCKPNLLEKIEVPIFLIGLGQNQNIKGDYINKMLSLKAINSIKKINKIASVSTVRDYHTDSFLRSLGCNNHYIELDPANFVKVNKRRKKNIVAINLAQHAPVLGRYDGDKEFRKNNLLKIKKVCNYIRSINHKIVIVAHDALEHSLYTDLQKMLSFKLGYLNTDDLDEMLSVYSSCKLTIAMKMHSCIMSFASGTPFINLYYDLKSVGYMNQLDNYCYGLSVFDYTADQLCALIDMSLNWNTALTTEINDLKIIHSISFNKTMDKICDIVKTID